MPWWWRVFKYPRTRHLEGSRLQPGDHDLDSVKFAALAGAHLVVEEKVDGANAAISFDADGTLLLQSRGHFLTGGDRERHFNLFKTWAAARQAALREVLGTRYVMYGEWLYAKHTIFYDRLPHYFLEFDVLDLGAHQFLSTPQRRKLLSDLPIVSVPVLRAGSFTRLEALTRLVAPSLLKSRGWRESLRTAAVARGLDAERAARETDSSDEMEGLYIKHEDETRVVGRYKWVRASFLTSVLDSGTHWLSRPIMPNRLADGVELFAP
jgi:hypothetical protein